MLILNAQEVRQALPMREAIRVTKRAYAALSAGRAEVPLRSQVPVTSQEAVSLFMPAYVYDQEGDSLAVKVVSVYPHNPERGLPVIHAVVLVLDVGTGRPLALLEGGTLTAIRTGAASGAATDLLARPDSRVAAIFGAGVQGRTQLEAVCSVRTIETAWIYDPHPEKAAQLIEELVDKGPIPGDLRIAENPQQAAAAADVICTATTSSTPVFDDRHIRPGTHLNGVGSYTPAMQEVPSQTVARARVFVDSRQACLAEAGDLIQPLQAGVITTEHILAELGELVLRKIPGRTAPDQITLFKSVGVAVQDTAAAQLALANARRLGLGQEVAL